MNSRLHCFDAFFLQCNFWVEELDVLLSLFEHIAFFEVFLIQLRQEVTCQNLLIQNLLSHNLLSHNLLNHFNAKTHEPN